MEKQKKKSENLMQLHYRTSEHSINQQQKNIKLLNHQLEVIEQAPF